MDIKEMERKFEDYLNSDECKAYLENEKKKEEIRNNRFIRFEEWLKHNDFDKLIYRLIHEHDKEYREKCWHKGYEPYPNNKLYFIFNYVENNLEPIEGIIELETIFSNSVWSFKGYYFQVICGQGCIYRIINKEDKRIILQV